MNPSVQAHLLQARQCLASIASSHLTLREGLCLWNKAHAGRVTNIYRLTIVYTLAIRVLPALGEHPLAEICRMDRHQFTAAVPHWQQRLARGRMKEVLFGMKLLLIVVQWLHTEGRMARPRFLPLRERPVSRMPWRGDRPTCQAPRVMAKPIPLKFRQYPGPSRRRSITHAARAKAA